MGNSANNGTFSGKLLDFERLDFEMVEIVCGRRTQKAEHAPLEEGGSREPSPDQALPQVAATEDESAHEAECAAEPQSTMNIDPPLSSGSTAQEAEVQLQSLTQEESRQAMIETVGGLIQGFKILSRELNSRMCSCFLEKQVEYQVISHRISNWCCWFLQRPIRLRQGRCQVEYVDMNGLSMILPSHCSCMASKYLFAGSGGDRDLRWEPSPASRRKRKDKHQKGTAGKRTHHWGLGLQDTSQN